jgi:mRNA-degrading endonuclease YafQ of YafQ-DinJ toxin-antitoxin module
MTEIAFSKSFHKAFRRKVRNQPPLEERFWERVAIFRDNPYDPRLKAHKLSGSMRGWWSFSVEYNVRVVFSFVEPGRVVFVDIGTHDEVY